ncbi:MAG: XRE family transcriptional regulator, partial [Phototrophicales bacterium]
MDNQNLKIFGKIIAFLRKNRGWSQEDLASRANLHRTYIGSIERGEQNISLKNIIRLTEAFDISLADLFSYWDYI